MCDHCLTRVWRKQCYRYIKRLLPLLYEISDQQQYKQKTQPSKAIPFLGTAFETAEIIFDKRLESPQLTSSLTSLAIMLAHAYASTNQIDAANALLQHLNRKMKCAIDCALGYATKVAFFEHCSKAITEAKTDIVFSQSYLDSHVTRH